MKIKPFAVEEWMNAWEVGAKYNIAETCVDSISMNELFELTGEDKTEFLNRLCARRLSYGNISEPHVSYVKPKADTTALVYYDLDIPSYEFCEEMYKKTGAFVTPGDCFEVPHSMRIGYAYGKQDLIDGLKAISEYIAMKTR